MREDVISLVCVYFLFFAGYEEEKTGSVFKTCSVGLIFLSCLAGFFCSVLSQRDRASKKKCSQIPQRACGLNWNSQIIDLLTSDLLHNLHTYRYILCRFFFLRSFSSSPGNVSPEAHHAQSQRLRRTSPGGKAAASCTAASAPPSHPPAEMPPCASSHIP